MKKLVQSSTNKDQIIVGLMLPMCFRVRLITLSKWLKQPDTYNNDLSICQFDPKHQMIVFSLITLNIQKIHFTTCMYRGSLCAIALLQSTKRDWCICSFVNHLFDSCHCAFKWYFWQKKCLFRNWHFSKKIGSLLACLHIHTFLVCDWQKMNINKAKAKLNGYSHSSPWKIIKLDECRKISVPNIVFLFI